MSVTKLYLKDSKIILKAPYDLKLNENYFVISSFTKKNIIDG